MAAQNPIRVEPGRVPAPDIFNDFQSLFDTTANIVGTAYQGKAFVPTLITNSLRFSNTITNIIGTRRQNSHEHLYDDFSCNSISPGYHAAATWLGSGGNNLYFTRVLGIGSGQRDLLTGKMKGAGFRADQAISFGSIDHQRSYNRLANAGGEKGCVGFLLTKLSRESLTFDDSGFPADTLDMEKIEYFEELGLEGTEHFLTKVFIFNEGVKPSFENSVPNDLLSQGTAAFNNNLTLKKTSTPKIKLVGYNPNSNLVESSQVLKAGFNIVTEEFHILEKQEGFNDLVSNKFGTRFFQKGFMEYASFQIPNITPSFFINEETVNTMLLTKSFTDEEKQNLTDYNSWESEYTTAKTPWVTSQPVDRTGFKDAVNNNRLNIHNKVQNLFKFYSLSEGDVGNNIRIKINITKRGNNEVSDIRLKTDTVLSSISQNYSANVNDVLGLIEDLDEDYTTFDVYIYKYNPRDNSFGNPLDTFKDLNLNPYSENFIGRKIGSRHTYYDFDADRVVEKDSIYPNNSQYVRVEIDDSIYNITRKNQHMLLPAGFRSYPHIELNKNSFPHYDVHNVNHDTVFDTDGVVQLPPQYYLNYVEDKTINNFENHWGVCFFDVQLNVTDNIQEFKHNTVQSQNLIPNFYYSKYFLSGIDKEGSTYRNVWVEEDNYLNSYFNLEKIITKIIVNDDGKNKRPDVGSDTSSDIRYKHSGRNITSAEFRYLDLDFIDDANSNEWSIWQDSRELKEGYNNKLSFDLFTYGGFDGVDIRDYDKRFMTNDAISREVLGEDSTSKEEGATLNSFKKAIDIALDDAYSTADIFVMPTINELSLIQKVINKCDESKNTFFIADAAGVAINNLINYEYIDNDAPEDDIVVKSSYGIMGSYYRASNKLIDADDAISEEMFIDESLDSANESQFSLLNNVLGNFTYSQVAKDQFNYILNNWGGLSLSSKYFMPVFSYLKAGSGITFQLAPETYVLGQIAQLIDTPRNNLTDLPGNINYLNVSNLTISLIDDKNLSEDIDDKQTFNLTTDKALESKLNLITRENESPISLQTQKTSYEVEKSIFVQQEIVRALQEVRKRIKFDIFLNESLVMGGFLFAQNSNTKNLTELLKIQLDTLLRGIQDEGLIDGFRVVVPDLTDEQAILDMQNYILRGNIVLSFNTTGSNNIISLNLDSILKDLSILTDANSEAVLIPQNII